ncbi:Ecp9-9 [Fulvia fulva]|uniref:Ecp9-9 n=1 Tax=Passalora fulva TaxID=5499 RepID=A0A1P8YXL3_PASFU|nr:Ecp9-9 [Fulvia fulva]AQA29252.1 extracellular protein 9-9 [Fulvia fulva]KAK4623708.1 Ecp9-9 [Fulvia fulva]KAK4624840.1 Ecp9-9 [Fulvia fulva]UJO17573.1 Ecp9-9 [Fulvia fulva]WPV15153.1 Ecp9-9 [Fulvia fulva]
MKLVPLSCLLGLASFGLASFGLADYSKFCNYGTAGDGSCEQEGYHTFCCMDDKRGEYVHHMTVRQWPNSLNPEGTTSHCGNNWEGEIWCA